MDNQANLKPPDAKLGSSWPIGVRWVVSIAIVIHLASVLAANLGVRPCSPLEEAFRNLFARYYEVLDQGYSHRYYSEIGPTPIVTAELRFSDGRPNQTIRLPERSMRPRLRYQRYLALAHWLADDHEGFLAKSYARHLCLTNPGCSGVAIRLQHHEIPDVDRLLTEGRRGSLNVDAAEFFTDMGLIGDFPCPTE